MPRYLKYSQVVTKQASSTSQMYEAMSRIEMDDPKEHLSRIHTPLRGQRASEIDGVITSRLNCIANASGSIRFES